MSDTSNKGLGSSTMDEETKNRIKSGDVKPTSKDQDMGEFGQKGGEAVQESDSAHELTDEE